MSEELALIDWATITLIAVFSITGFFNGFIKDSKDLVLPHPRAHLRNFVLYPILEIDPKWSHPILKKNAQFLINNLSQKSRIEITRLNKNVKIRHDKQ